VGGGEWPPSLTAPPSLTTLKKKKKTLDVMVKTDLDLKILWISELGYLVSSPNGIRHYC
jgi:hypothetical protein